jgi:hypothetical protein
MQMLLALALFAFIPCLPAAMVYSGDYELVAAYDDKNVAVNIPSDIFQLQMEAMNENEYRFSLKLGNSLGGSMIVDGNTARISDMYSTMMMPPPSIFELESAISSILPEVNKVGLDINTLTLEGSQGKVIFQKIESH